MATSSEPIGTENIQAAARRGPRRLRWSSADYYRLADLGFFRGKRVELIEGEIIQMAALKPPHVVALDLTAEAIRVGFGAGFYVRTQTPLDLGRSQPEPDVAVVRGQPRDYGGEHPRTALLVVEISETSLGYDRRRKAHIYAQAGVADYWIVNLIARQLEIHRRPGPDPSRRGRFTYAEVTVVPEDGHASPLEAPQARIAVADLLP